MTYDETVNELTLRLEGWERQAHAAFTAFWRKGCNFHIIVRNPQLYVVDSGGEVCCWDESNRFVTGLEHMFENYMEASSEEVGMFKLNYGLDYPFELRSKK